MADKISRENYLDINLGFVDEDTRKIKIPNARDDYSVSEFTALEAKLKPQLGGAAVSFFVGDRTGAEFAGILYADKINTQKTDFDIAN